ncbi:MAG: RDD family protein [Nitrospirae bacterium]|nr:MAG: RDD family protein [Nitrospirota bacterium]
MASFTVIPEHNTHKCNSDALPSHLRYAGFWIRLWASLLDTILVLMIVVPFLQFASGSALPSFDFSGETSSDLMRLFYVNSWSLVGKGPVDFLISWVLPAIAVLAFWICRSATPGKMAIGAKIVDATSFTDPTVKQLIVRYVGYYLSMLPIFPPLGIIWIAFDPRKQGWHDKLAGTVVVRKKRGGDDSSSSFRQFVLAI